MTTIETDDADDKKSTEREFEPVTVAILDADQKRDTDKNAEISVHTNGQLATVTIRADFEHAEKLTDHDFVMAQFSGKDVSDYE